MSPEIVMAHILINWDWKTIVGILMIVILVYGMFIGPKGKARDPKQQRKYDKVEKNKLEHYLHKASGDYAYKGTGMYKDANGKVHYEKNNKK